MRTSTSAVSVVLYIVSGILAIVTLNHCYLAFRAWLEISGDREPFELAEVFFVSTSVVFGLAAITQRLSEIEQHLRHHTAEPAAANSERTA